MTNRIPRSWTFVIPVFSLVVVVSTYLEWKTHAAPEVHTSTEEEPNQDPLDGGQPVSPTLLGEVGAAHQEILGNGSAAFGPNCLKIFPRSFERGEELTEVPSALLAGIAGYESGGCIIPKGGPGNIMHIVLPDDEHVTEAAHLLDIPEGALDWRRYSEHSVVLGAVMLQDYYGRTGSVEAALAAYRNGPSSDKEGERYAHLVLAHGVAAIRYQWNWVTEAPVHYADPVEEIDVRSLAPQMRLSPVEAPPSLLAMQE